MEDTHKEEMAAMEVNQAPTMAMANSMEEAVLDMVPNPEVELVDMEDNQIPEADMEASLAQKMIPVVKTMVVMEIN